RGEQMRTELGEEQRVARRFEQRVRDQDREQNESGREHLPAEQRRCAPRRHVRQIPITRVVPVAGSRARWTYVRPRKPGRCVATSTIVYPSELPTIGICPTQLCPPGSACATNGAPTG